MAPSKRSKSNSREPSLANGDAADGKVVINEAEVTSTETEAENKKPEKANAAPNDDSAPDSSEDTGAAKAEKAKASKFASLKKSIPSWATLPAKKAGGKITVEKQEVTATDLVLNAIKETANPKGVASVAVIRAYCKDQRPNWEKSHFKKAMTKAMDKGLIEQVKGQGMSGSFKLTPKNRLPKATTKDGKAKKTDKKVVKKEDLDHLLANIFTWVCEPKEASSKAISKYIAEHYKHLDAEGKAFKKALLSGVEKRQLWRITGQSGIHGTYSLVDNADKTGTKYEDAIEDAIIAMNEPKDASIPKLRDYLHEFHTEFNVTNKPRVLMNTLERCEAKGWIKRISGKGFSGKFRLNYPYFPSPSELWGEWYDGHDKPQAEQKQKEAKRKRKQEETDDEDEEEDDEEDSEDEEEEVIPAKKQRGAPGKRSLVTPKTAAKKTAAKKPAPKSRAKKPVAKKSSPAKKTSAKKGGKKRR